METANITDKQIKEVRRRLFRFSEEMCYSCNYNDIIKYLYELKSELAPKTLRSHVIDIRILLRHIDAPIADDTKLPQLPKTRKIIIRDTDIQQLIYQSSNLNSQKISTRLKASILLTATSGLRPEELYKLTLNDIDIDNRIIYLRAEITKTREERVPLFFLLARGVVGPHLSININLFLPYG